MKANFPSVIAHHKKELRERRERMATALMAALIANEYRGRNVWDFYGLARDAVDGANALLNTLDTDT